MQRSRERPSLGGGGLAKASGSRLERAEGWAAPRDVVTNGTVTGGLRATCRFWPGLSGKWMMVSSPRLSPSGI